MHIVEYYTTCRRCGCRGTLESSPLIVQVPERWSRIVWHNGAESEDAALCAECTDRAISLEDE